jgi:hypothetical protein
MIILMNGSRRGAIDQSLLDIATAPNLRETDMLDLARVPGTAGVNIGKRLAQRPDLTPNVGTILANVRWVPVREALAANENTPAEALEVLANDEVESVRVAARNNPNYRGKGGPFIPLTPTDGGTPGFLRPFDA